MTSLNIAYNLYSNQIINNKFYSDTNINCNHIYKVINRNLNGNVNKIQCVRCRYTIDLDYVSESSCKHNYKYIRIFTDGEKQYGCEKCGKLIII